jgi:FAD/FMN-containing dehydrogenase
VFHAGDGNLHPNISFDRRDSAVAGRVRRACRDIMAACVAAGGSITGEHGVGNDKLDYMAWIFDPDTLGAMQAVRRAFDPSELANPGKVVPVHACREWSAVRSLRR